MGASWEPYRNGWRLSITGGGPRKYFTPKNKALSAKDREQIRREVLNEQDRGVLTLDLKIFNVARQNRIDAEGKTLAQEFEGFLAAIEEAGGATGTARARALWFRNYIAPEIGDKLPRQVTQADVIALIRKARERGLAHHSLVNGPLATVSKLFTWLIEEKKYVDGFGNPRQNPAFGLQKLCGKKPEANVSPLDKAQQDKLTVAARDKGYKVEAIVLLGLRAGLRIKEALRLNVTDVDLEQGTILVRGTKSRSSVRVLPIRSADLRNALRFWLKERAELEAYSDLLFPSFSGGPIDPSNWTREVFKPLLNSCGIVAGRKRGGKTFHALRHTFATKLYNKEKDLGRVSKALGHANTLITQQVYVHMKAVELPESLDLDS